MKRLIAGAVVFVAAGLVYVAGGGAVLLMSNIEQAPIGRFLAPGDAAITVTDDGTYNVWYEFKTIYDGTVYNKAAELPDGWKIKIVRADSGEPIALDMPRGYGRTTTELIEGYVIGQADLQAGQYHIAVTGDSDQRVISVTKDAHYLMLVCLALRYLAAPLLLVIGMTLTLWGGFICYRKRRERLARDPWAT